MNYNVKSIGIFERQAKRLIRKYASLQGELLTLISELRTSPQQGTPLGNNCYKIRLAVSSKGKGKSAGARVITNVVIIEKNVYLLTIYDKPKMLILATGSLLNC